MRTNPAHPSRARVQRHRDTLRQRGMRPIQIWVPDTRAPNFAVEAQRQSLAVNTAERQDGTMDWIEAVSDFDDEAR